MEAFDPSVGVHGSAWVTAVLEKNLHKTSEAAKAVVEKILTPKTLAGAESCVSG